MFKKFFKWIKDCFAKAKTKAKNVNWKKVKTIILTTISIASIICSIVLAIRNRKLRMANAALVVSLAEKTVECDELYTKLMTACKYVKQYFCEAAKYKQMYYDMY